MEINLDTGLKLGEIVTMIVGAASALIVFVRTSTRIQMTLEGQSVDISGLQEEIKKLGEVISNQQLQNQRLDSMEKRLDRSERWYDELRRGVGKIEPG